MQKPLCSLVITLFLCIPLLLHAQDSVRVQDSIKIVPKTSPVDSLWALDHGDTLLFHHDGTREYERANGSRELRFGNGKRLYFFVPPRFIESAAFLSKDFQEVNRLTDASRCIIKFKLQPSYSTPKVFISGIHREDAKGAVEQSEEHKKEYTFKIPFDEPNWYIVEIAANRSKHTIETIARILVCVGDQIPLPFDTLQEFHAPLTLPRTDERLIKLLNDDRERVSLLPLQSDSLPLDVMQPVLTTLIERKFLYGVITSAGLKSMAPSLFSSDTNILGGFIVSGETPEEIAWILLSSPMLSTFGYLQKAASVGIIPMRSESGLHVAFVFRGKKE
ncbi:MAG TPA: hypothetical protein VFJ29_01365 [Candidatus Kapabacteria bacterium]|nr:hypothetical protein [Candidatus Kapabacteria bacterium]